MSLFTKLPKELYSPEAFAGFTAGAEFSLGNARALIWMSQLAYETDERQKIIDILNLWGMTLVGDGIVVEEATTVLPKSSTQCFVAAGRGTTVIAFQGTDPVVLANWITDFDAHLDSTGTARGYQLAADAVYQKLQTLLGPAAPGRNIFVTGHSLGGALAVLIAHRLSTDRYDVQAVYTYGMPRPGDPNFAGVYNTALGPRTYRLVHGEDLVPTVAPSALNFRHVGRYLHCERGGKFAGQPLAAGASDDPQFAQGVSKEFAEFLHGPITAVLDQAGRAQLALALAFGHGPAGMRTDPGGIAIELLPPRLRDHMPDRYIGACTS